MKVEDFFALFISNTAIIIYEVVASIVLLWLIYKQYKIRKVIIKKQQENLHKQQQKEIDDSLINRKRV
jgi:hypothetical protein